MPVLTLYIYGAGDLGKEIYAYALRMNEVTKRYFETVFVIDEKNMSENRTSFCGAVLRSYQSITDSEKSNSEIIMAIGEPDVRAKMYNEIKADGFIFAVIIDPNAVVLSTAKIREGVIISPNAFVSSDVCIGENSLLQPGCTIGHDAKIGKNTVISSLTAISGHCIIGDNTYIAVGVPVKEGVKIGSETIIGLGSVVSMDIDDCVIASGNPAKEITKNRFKRVFIKFSNGSDEN